MTGHQAAAIGAEDGRATVDPRATEAALTAASGTTAATVGAEVPDAPRATDELRLVTLDEIRAAAEDLRGVTLRTPLLPFGRPLSSDRFGRTRAYLKPESLQPIGAFKLRGAYHAIASLDERGRAAGVVTHSSGNHAQGVARAARLLGVKAVIVMPRDAPPVKVAGVTADGAEIVTVGPSSEERAERARELARSEGLALIPPYDDRRVIAGQGTVGLEIVEQVDELVAAGNSAMPDLAPRDLVVLVPVGGGGLASGVATAVKSLLPSARVVGVEPVLAADAQESLRLGRLVQWTAEQMSRTAADGMRTVALGVLPFAHLTRYLDVIVTVEEVEIQRAMARAAREARLVLEPSGATALAALLFHEEEIAPGPGPASVVAVLSGGNVEPERFLDMVRAGIHAGG